MPKYGGRKGSKAENEDAPAEAGASFLVFASTLPKDSNQPLFFATLGFIKHKHVMPKSHYISLRMK